MGFPRYCDICLREKTNADFFDGNIELNLKAIIGDSHWVLLVGQDPTVARGAIYSALDLDNTSGRLYKYVVGEILQPVGLSVDDTYATDLIKCRFPNNQTPKIISQNHGIGIREFLSPFFSNCRQ